MTNIAIFASGNGSNAENIHQQLKNDNKLNISLIICNNPNAFVLERAKKLNIPSKILDNKSLNNKDYFLSLMEEYKIDFIVLSGYLKLIPSFLIEKYPQKIVNIHPALLPKFGGKGMYGMAVHNAVVENKEKESGITIHYVSEKYDDGEVIFQAKCSVDLSETAESLAEKIHTLEYQHYPQVIKSILKNK